MTIGEIGTQSVVTAHPHQSVVEVARLMRDKHVGAVVIVDMQQRPVGLVTDRDIVVSAVAQSADKIDALLASDVMTVDAVVGRAHEALDEAFIRMRAHGVRRLPIVGSDGRLEGIVTFDDLLKVMAVELGGLVAVMTRERRQEELTRR